MALSVKHGDEKVS